MGAAIAPTLPKGSPSTWPLAATTNIHAGGFFFADDTRSAQAHNGMRHCRRKVEPMAAKPRRRGRDAITGRFIPVMVAERRRKTAIVETIKAPKKKGKK